MKGANRHFLSLISANNNKGKLLFMRQTLIVALLIIAASTFALSQTMGRKINYIRPGGSSVAERTATTRETAKQKTQKIKVYLVALDDKGKTGRKIGCDDSLVAVTRTINATAAPLKAAIKELLASPHESDGQLGNYVVGPNLKLKSASISKGTATIRFSGKISVAGICDEPRIVEQIEATAKQFSTVKKVKVYVGNQTLKYAIS
jgi:spore germination protein GerM